MAEAAHIVIDRVSHELSDAEIGADPGDRAAARLWRCVVLTFVGRLLPGALSAFNGARSTEQVLIWSARSLGTSRWRVLWEVMRSWAADRIERQLDTRM
jgi:hypothetical protein